MKLITLLTLLITLPCLGFDRHKPAYILYNQNGRQVSYRNMMRDVSTADILLFGELHDNPISHWLQLEVTRDLFNELDGRIILGAEMFEADNQIILDEYTGGLISDSRFEDEARLWRNYKTDYKPLVLFARENSLYFVASNIPRRYANMVFHGGIEALEKISREATGYITPLPFLYDPELPGYKSLTESGGGAMMHPGENLAKAQAIKDATMAHFIFKNLVPGKLMIHFHGAYHSDFFEGIYWYLKQQDPDLRVVTVTTTTQEDPRELDVNSMGRADYIIVVTERMTRTH